MANSWLRGEAALPVEEAEAELAAAVADPEAEDDAALEVSAAEELSAAEVCERASAVALRVPHFWLVSQTDCPSALFGLAPTH